MNSNVASYFNGIDNDWTYWTYENLTNPGSGMLFTQAVCTVLGGTVAAVGLAVAGVAALIFGSMALGPVGLALAGIVTIGLAASSSLAVVATIGAALNTLFQSAFLGHGGMRYVYERNFEGLTNLHKEEFHSTMKEPLGRRFGELLEELNGATVDQREGLVDKYKNLLDQEFAAKFPGLDRGDVRGKELVNRLTIEKALFIFAIYQKLGDPNATTNVEE